MQIVLCPRWSGDGLSDWYPWLRRRLEVPIRVAELDVPNAPTIAGCIASLERALGSTLESTLLVGHSVGCQALLRYLAASGSGAGSAAGLLAVAGWFEIDEPWDTIRPWIEAPLDAERARSRVARTRVLLSDNDPFTADWRANQAAWEQRMGAEVRVHPGRRHFNEAEEPAVLEAILELLG